MTLVLPVAIYKGKRSIYGIITENHHQPNKKKQIAFHRFNKSNEYSLVLDKLQWYHCLPFQVV